MTTNYERVTSSDEPDYDFGKKCTCWSGSYPEKTCPAHEYWYNPELAGQKERTEKRNSIKRWVDSHPDIIAAIKQDAVEEERERIKGIINEAIKPGPGRKLTFFFEDMIIKTCREILEKIG